MVALGEAVGDSSLAPDRVSRATQGGLLWVQEKVQVVAQGGWALVSEAGRVVQVIVFACFLVEVHRVVVVSPA